ncbi:pantoate--beta-alanine ligase [Humidisolicoccus flavus]|uniref:pantoate--beta-alanine ligase n=1 Tax=Humidisolicoccus flavus TaxID=3111414 RepID=UPI0032471304
MAIPVFTTIEATREHLATFRKEQRTIALVPTMGALHAGHLELIEAAKEVAQAVVVSIFVNPLQFGQGEDLERYPRTFEADLRQLEQLGVDAVFHPDASEMYPEGVSATKISSGHVGTILEGRSRPGHFDGVLTVVSKLFNVVQPDFALFGQKDAQQLFVVKRMARELNFPIQVIGVETVREPDGLALSSRNRFLTDGQRRDALALSRALDAAVCAADRGVETMLAAAQSVFQGDSAVALDYLAIVHPETFAFVGDDHHGDATVVIAAKVGNVRLIDNRSVRIP